MLGKKGRYSYARAIDVVKFFLPNEDIERTAVKRLLYNFIARAHPFLLPPAAREYENLSLYNDSSIDCVKLPYPEMPMNVLFLGWLLTIHQKQLIDKYFLLLLMLIQNKGVIIFMGYSGDLRGF